MKVQRVVRSLARFTMTRFILVGGLSFLADASVLWVLAKPLGMPLVPATTLAFAAAFGVNFWLNRSLTFRSDGSVGRQLIQYSILVGLNLVVTLIVVVSLVGLGANLIISKAAATLLIGAFNILAFKHWVFATRSRCG